MKGLQIGCLLCIWINCLHAVNLPMQLDLSCDSSVYSNKELSCVGNVQLDAYPFKLRGQRLHWQEERHCYFLEGAPLARVEYLLSDASNPLAQFNIQAEQMSLVTDDVRRLARVTAQTQVDCEYLIAGKLSMHAQGDYLLVKNSQETSAYQIFLESKEDKLCHVEMSQGFQAEAKCFEYDTASSYGSAQAFQGEIDLDLEEGPGRLSVKADRMVWDGVKGNLILDGNVLLSLYANKEKTSEPFCTLMAEKRLICQCVLTPQVSCHKVQIEGPMQLKHDVWGLLTGSGVTLLDCLKNKVIARGLEGGAEEPAETRIETQVSLETSQGKIYADRIALDLYREGRRGFSLHAQGHVGIEAVQGQYALAHEMHYDTRTQQGELLSNTVQRVLFWEPRYELTLSAPSCQFTLRDPETGKMQVKGNGDVRMTFFDMERKKLQTRFPSYEQR